MCRINNFAGSSAANTFKIEGVLRAPLYPNHESGHSSGGAWCGDSWKIWVPNETAALRVLKQLGKVIFFFWADVQHIHGKAMWKDAQSSDPIPLLFQSPLSLFLLASLTVQNSRATSGSVINGGQPEGHVGTCAGKGHELGVELQTSNRACVFAI